MKNQWLVDIFNIEDRGDLERILDCGESTDVYAFFADPAGHSLSPLMHNTAFEKLDMDAVYFASRVPEGRIGEAMDNARSLGIQGMNISMPHKRSVIEFLDEVDPWAEVLEAVNTIHNFGGEEIKYGGSNTDAYGAARSLMEFRLPESRGTAVLLGLGGAGKAILTALLTLGYERISIFLRNPAKPEYAQFMERMEMQVPVNPLIELCPLDNQELLRSKLAHAELLVNATDVGMGSHMGESLIPDSAYLHGGLAVMDAIYSPAETKLLAQAREAGCRGYKNGLDMLIYQGARAFEIFTGRDMPLEEVRKILSEHIDCRRSV